MRHKLNFLFGIILCFYFAPTVSHAFCTDTVSQKFSEAAHSYFDRKILQGYPDKTCLLEQEINRVEAATILIRFRDLSEKNSDKVIPPRIRAYVDFLDGMWWSYAVAKAFQERIIRGETELKIRPADPIIFAEGAAMVLRTFFREIDLDKNQVWYQPYLEILTENNIQILPKNKKITRGELLNLLYSVEGKKKAIALSISEKVSKLSDWVTSDERLDCLSGMSIYTSVYENYFNLMIGTPLMTSSMMAITIPKEIAVHKNLVEQYNKDFFVQYNSAAHFEKAMAYFKEKSPTTLLGTYFSGTGCSNWTLPDHNVFPKNIAKCSDYPKEEIKEIVSKDFDHYFLNYSNPEVSEKLQEEIVNEAKNRKFPFIYLDNFQFEWDTSKKFGVTTAVTLKYLAELKEKMNKNGIKMAINMAVLPHYLSENNFQNAENLLKAIDGISYEQPFHQMVRRDLTKVLKEFEVHRRFLDHKKLVILMSAAVQEPIEAIFNEYYFIAALAYLLREQGDAIFVSRYGTEVYEVSSWYAWPQKFGKPKGKIETFSNENTWYIHRNYEGGGLTAENVTASPKDPTEILIPSGEGIPYTIIRKPIHGTFTFKDAKTGIYTPDYNYYFAQGQKGIDHVVLGANPYGKSDYRDVLVINFSVFANKDLDK